MRPDQQDELRSYLRAKLKELGWSITVLAERSGVARSTLYNFLSGTASASYSVLLRIAGATGDNPDEMLALAGLTEEAPGRLLNDDEAAKEYLRLLAAIEDDDEREQAVAMVEQMLKVVAQRRKEARARRKDSSGHGIRQAPRSAPADG